MQRIDPNSWRSLETLVHSRFGKFIRQLEQDRDFRLLMESEAASARLVAADPESAAHNSKRLLILTSILKAPATAIADSEKRRCLRQAFEVEALLLKNQCETRIEDLALIEFRSNLREIAASLGDDAGAVEHCERLLEYILHYANGGFGTAAAVVNGYEVLRLHLLPPLLRVDPSRAEARLSHWLNRFQSVAAARFPELVLPPSSTVDSAK